MDSKFIQGSLIASCICLLIALVLTWAAIIGTSSKASKAEAIAVTAAPAHPSAPAARPQTPAPAHASAEPAAAE